MAETKADLQAEIDRLREQNASYHDRLGSLDAEALALSQIVNALKKWEPSRSSYSTIGSDHNTVVGRILAAAAARFGIVPDWERFDQLIANMKPLTDSERAELTELREAQGYGRYR